MTIDKRKFLDYSTLILFVASSGFSYFSSPIISVFQFILLLSIFIIRKKYLNISFFFFFLILFIITLLQALDFSFFSAVSSMGLFLMVINAYLIVKILGEKFISYYINILYCLAVISLVIFFSLLLVPSIAVLYSHIVSIFQVFNLSNSPHETILIYNFGLHTEVSFRNSGPFWEPGAFAGYLSIAYIFYFFTIIKKIDKKSIVFLVAIFTTFSTTTFLALFIFFFFVYLKKIKNIIFKVVAVSIMCATAIYAYNTFDFMGKKIESQLKMAQEKGIQRSDDSQRFLSILRDYTALQGHELIGRGGHNSTRYNIAPGGKFVIPTVGLTDVIVRYGIPFFILMLYFLYTSVCKYLKHLNKSNQFYCTAIVATILMTLLSEVYFGYSMYWSLLFLQFAYNLQKER